MSMLRLPSLVIQRSIGKYCFLTIVLTLLCTSVYAQEIQSSGRFAGKTVEKSVESRAASPFIDERITLEESTLQYWLNGEVSLAIQSLGKLISIEQSTFGKEHDRIAFRYRQLANFYLEHGDSQKAQSLVALASEILMKNRLAETWQGKEAIRFEEDIKKKIDSRETAWRTSIDLEKQMQQAARDLRFEDAITTAESFVELAIQQWGERHPYALAAKVDLEGMRLWRGVTESTMPQLDSLFSSLEQVNPPNHPLGGTVLLLQSTVKQMTGDLKASLRLTEESIERFEQGGSTFIPDYVRALNQQGNLLFELGDTETALAALRKARKESVQTMYAHSQLSDAASSLCNVLESMAKSRWRRHEWTQAKNLFSESFEIAQSTWSNDAYRLLDIQRAIELSESAVSWTKEQVTAFDKLEALSEEISTLIRQGQSLDALRKADLKLRLSRDAFGNKSPMTLQSERIAINLRIKYQRYGTNEFAEVLKSWAVFEQQFANVFGTKHPDYADLCYGIAIKSDECGADPIVVLEYAIKSRDAYQDATWNITDELLVAETLVGKTLARQGDEACVEMLSDVIQDWASRPSRGSYKHFTAVKALADYYQSEGSPYESAEYLTMAIEICRQLKPAEPVELVDLLKRKAILLFEEEMYFEAKKFYLEALAILESSDNATLGDGQRPTYVSLLYNTASCCYWLGQLEEAEKLIAQSIAAFNRPVDPPPELLDSYFLLANVLRQASKPEDAHNAMALAGECARANFASESTQAAELAVEQAELLLSQQNRTQASKRLAAAVNIIRSLYNAPEGSSETETLVWLLDRCVKGFEDAGDWTAAVNTRIFVTKVAAPTLAGWPHIAEYERRQLEEAKLIARSTDHEKKSVDLLRARTAELKKSSRQDFQSVPKVDLDLEKVYGSVEKTLGGASLIVADYCDVATSYWLAKEDFVRAYSNQSIAVKYLVELLGEQHPRTAESFAKFASIARQLGVYQLSKSMLELSYKHLADINGEKSRSTILTKLELGKLYLNIKDYTSALPLVREVVDTLAKSSGTFGQDYALALETQGMIYDGLRESELAEKYLADSHALLSNIDSVSSRILSENKSRWAIVVAKNIASKESVNDKLREAHQYYEAQSLTHQSSYFEFAIEYAYAMNRWGDYEDAIHLLRSLEMKLNSSQVQQKDFYRLRIASGKGIAFSKVGKLVESRDELSKAAQMREVLLSKDSYLQLGIPNSGIQLLLNDKSGYMDECIAELALVEHLLGEHESALNWSEKGLKSQNANLKDAGQIVSDTSINRTLAGNENRLDVLLSILSSMSPSPSNATRALDWTIQQKGIALDISCRRQALQQSRMFDSGVMKLSNQIRLLREELTKLAIQAPTGESDRERESRQDSVIQQIASLSSSLAIALRNSGKELNIPEIQLSELCKRLKKDSLYIEFIQFNRFSFVEGESRKTPHYLAFLVRGQDPSSCMMKDLGETAKIDQLVSDLRKQTLEVPGRISIFDESRLESEFKKISQQLFHLLFNDWELEIAAAESVIFSPDGVLCALPFNALVNSEGHYLVESIDVSQLASARDLVREKTTFGRGTLLLASPNYDADVQLRKESSKAIAESPDGRSLFAVRGLSLRWQRLPGTEGEASDVNRLLANTPFTPVKTFLHNDATEELLKRVQSPRIVHIATHGFYLPEQSKHDSNRTTQTTDAGSELSRLRSSRNPLLRSGLVMAGANRTMNKSDSSDGLEDGWLTAQEITALDLRNTQLVVLSACESGLGDVQNGQGVQGLRRAFTCAGAQSILMSLFDVPDAETRELMRMFYEGFRVNSNEVKSINDAQRTMMNGRRGKFGGAHPYFWASFMICGNYSGN
jgi:CHAT domain-containing protein